MIDTDMKYVLPSPNLPTVDSLYNYLATCYFEGTNLSEGRGTTKPFSFFGAPWLKNRELIDELKTFNFEGVMFREAYFTPVFSKHKGELCNGVEVIVTDRNKFEPVILGMTLIKVIQKNHKEFEFRGPWSKGGNPMISLLTGSNFLYDNTMDLKEIKALFDKDKKVYEEVKGRYHLYE